MAIPAFIEIVKEFSKPGMVMAEVGAWIGETTVHYLPIVHANHGVLWIVDYFSGSIGDTAIHAHNPGNAPNVYRQFLRNCKPYLMDMRILALYSDEAAEFVPDESLDICFIDADHRYAPVSKDIDLYIKKVKKGGILCGHDYNGYHEGPFSQQQLTEPSVDGVHWGVVAAVQEHFGKDFEQRGDSVWLKRL